MVKRTFPVVREATTKQGDTAQTLGPGVGTLNHAASSPHRSHRTGATGLTSACLCAPVQCEEMGWIRASEHLCCVRLPSQNPQFHAPFMTDSAVW